MACRRACWRAPRQPPATATLSDAGRRVSAGRALAAWSPVSPKRVARRSAGSPWRTFHILEAPRVVGLAARREAPSQLFGRLDPDGMFHVPDSLRMRRKVGISDGLGRSFVPCESVCGCVCVPAIDRSMGPLSIARAALWVQERSGSDVSHPRDAAGVQWAWPNLESDLVWTVSCHGNGVTADGCHRLRDAKQPNAAVTQRRPPSSDRQALEDGGTTCSPDLSLSAACRAKGPRVREPLQTLARSHSRLLASRANGRLACSPMFGACFPCPPLSTTASPLVMKPWSNVRATRPPHQVPDALPSLPDRRK